jgi:CheY-like chemotaxis protein
MPGMTGIEAALHLRSTLPACKVLLVSGILTTPDLIANAAQHGNQFAVLQKPIHPDDLLAKIRTVMAE